jgi:hypothetical protein
MHLFVLLVPENIVGIKMRRKRSVIAMVSRAVNRECVVIRAAWEVVMKMIQQIVQVVKLFECPKPSNVFRNAPKGC